MISEFVLGLALFHTGAEDSDNEAKKLHFIFRIYDMDRDGYISNGELFQARLKSFYVIVCRKTLTLVLPSNRYFILV